MSFFVFDRLISASWAKCVSLAGSESTLEDIKWKNYSQQFLGVFLAFLCSLHPGWRKEEKERKRRRDKMNEASFWKDLPLALAAGFAAFMLFFVILLLGFEFIEWKKEGLRSDEVEKNR